MLVIFPVLPEAWVSIVLIIVFLSAQTCRSIVFMRFCSLFSIDRHHVITFPTTSVMKMFAAFDASPYPHSDLVKGANLVHKASSSTGLATASLFDVFRYVSWWDWIPSWMFVLLQGRHNAGWVELDLNPAESLCFWWSTQDFCSQQYSEFWTWFKTLQNFKIF